MCTAPELLPHAHLSPSAGKATAAKLVQEKAVDAGSAAIDAHDLPAIIDPKSYSERGTRHIDRGEGRPKGKRYCRGEHAHKEHPQEKPFSISHQTNSFLRSFSFPPASAGFLLLKMKTRVGRSDYQLYIFVKRKAFAF